MMDVMDVMDVMESTGHKAAEASGEAPMLSVIVPAFNRRAFVELCVLSLLRTTAPAARWEIIVVDDGSTDGTQACIEALRRPNVRCVRRALNIGKPNAPGLARNVGLRAARGEWVALLDSDVLHGADVIAATLEQVQGDGIYRCAGTWVLAWHKVGGGVCYRGAIDEASALPAMMWFVARRETLVEIGGYDERFTDYGHDDEDLYTRLNRAGYRWQTISGQFGIGLYAWRNGTGPSGMVDPEQNKRQEQLWRTDESIVRNEGIEWGRAE